MPVDAIVGAGWGDEGKGKWTDYFAAEADFVVRFQGGRNAGHTIVNRHGRFALHLLPSGVFYPGVVNILAPGVALDAPALFDELDTLLSQGVPSPRLFVSERCQFVLPYHILLDELEEERLADARFGSTKVGIAPFYADKALKLGVQVADLFDERRLRERIRSSLVPKNVLFEHLYKRAPLGVDEIAEPLLALRARLEPLVRNTTQLLREGLAAGKRVLVEGQLGALRDPDHGVFPFSTSSSPLAASAAVGAGLPVGCFERVVAVTKAYSSCVGATPFVTELEGAEAERLRKLGNEYGATTGRPRRVGFFDAVASRHGCQVQGATEVALTLLDVLGHYSEIPICTAYEIAGRRTTELPPVAELVLARPIYETSPGWGCDVSGARRIAELPIAARRYVERIEELLGAPIRWISVGPERDAVLSNP